jgi:hypothetical protein
MLPFNEDAAYRDYLARWAVAEKHFCTRPNLKDSTPLQVTNLEGLKELSFVFFAGWLFCGILNREKELVRPCLLPMGKEKDSSLLVLYDPKTQLVAPARRELELFDAEFFTCPLDTATKPLSLTEMRLCPVVNKLRYNLAHAKPRWDVTGLTEPSKTEDCCKSWKSLLWDYLGKTVCDDPDVYGPMVGGAAFPVRLPFAVLSEYLTGVNPRGRDFGTLLEETLLWFAMAKSGVLMGVPYVVFNRPHLYNEIDIALYECAGKSRTPKEEPPGGWSKHIENQALCVIELTIGHQSDPAKEQIEGGQESKKQGGSWEGRDVPKNKLVNFLALKSSGFRLVQTHYVSIVGDPDMAPATQQALTRTDGFQYVFLPSVVGEDMKALVLNQRDNRVPIATVRRWHEALIKVIEDAGTDFAAKLK